MRIGDRDEAARKQYRFYFVVVLSHQCHLRCDGDGAVNRYVYGEHVWVPEALTDVAPACSITIVPLKQQHTDRSQPSSSVKYHSPIQPCSDPHHTTHTTHVEP